MTRLFKSVTVLSYNSGSGQGNSGAFVFAVSRSVTVLHRNANDHVRTRSRGSTASGSYSATIAPTRAETCRMRPRTPALSGFRILDTLRHRAQVDDVGFQEARTSGNRQRSAPWRCPFRSRGRIASPAVQYVNMDAESTLRKSFLRSTSFR